MTLLLVEDDCDLGKGLKTALERAGYGVDWVQRGDDGLAAASAQDYDLLLLDLGLPELSGLDLLRSVRARGGAYCPVIIITARDRTAHRIEGLDAGADDYVLKPFDFDELLARLRSQLRRRDGRHSDQLIVHGLEVDLAGRVVRREGQLIPLAAREFKMLAFLARRLGRFASKTELENAIYNDDNEIESNTVEVAISSLRRKLGRDLIITARGIGYMIPR